MSMLTKATTAIPALARVITAPLSVGAAVTPAAVVVVVVVTTTCVPAVAVAPEEVTEAKLASAANVVSAAIAVLVSVEIAACTVGDATAVAMVSASDFAVSTS